MASSSGISRFLKTLHEAQNNGGAVAVYADSDDFQSYEVGFVEHADSMELVLLCLTPKGEPDGRRILRMEDVQRVDAENAYVKKLELLYQYRDSVFESEFVPHPKGVKPSIQSVLQNAHETNQIVHVVDGHDYGPTGFIREVGDDFVVINRIGPNGEPDGIATMLLANVTKVHVGRRNEQVLAFMYRYNYELKKLLG